MTKVALGELAAKDLAKWMIVLDFDGHSQAGYLDRVEHSVHQVPRTMIILSNSTDWHYIRNFPSDHTCMVDAPLAVVR